MKKLVSKESFNSISYVHLHACHELAKSVQRKHQEVMQVLREDFKRDELMWTSQKELLDEQ